MDTPKYDETLKFVYIKYEPILVSSNLSKLVTRSKNVCVGG